MGERYEQFLGTRPGIVVELIDDSASPYWLRTQDGFTFSISAEDFKSYYRKEGEPTPRRWTYLLTDPEHGLVDARTVARLMDVIHSFEPHVGDFDKARSLVRDVLATVGSDPRPDLKRVRAGLGELGWNSDKLTDEDFKRLNHLPDDIRGLLLSNTCAVIPFIDLPAVPKHESGRLKDSAPTASGARPAKSPGVGGAAKAKPAKGTSRGMKNIELLVDGDVLNITIDLSQEFGPSKSGKTTIIASTQGNKTIPGRFEKIGVNVYRKDTAKPTKGRRSEFKNVSMSVNGDLLLMTVDLSKEYGPSRSGQTIIIASTEGNQLVHGRSEKIGLNVYRKIE